MLVEYIDAALERAHYEIIDNPEPYYGEISACKGVWATGKTLEECRHNLAEVLDGWIVLRLQRGLAIPPLASAVVRPLERVPDYA